MPNGIGPYRNPTGSGPMRGVIKRKGPCTRSRRVNRPGWSKDATIPGMPVMMGPSGRGSSVRAGPLSGGDDERVTSEWGGRQGTVHGQGDPILWNGLMAWGDGSGRGGAGQMDPDATTSPKRGGWQTEDSPIDAGQCPWGEWSIQWPPPDRSARCASRADISVVGWWGGDGRRYCVGPH